MTDMKLEDRVNDLERRVSELEGSFGFLTGQVKGVHRSLLEFQSETRDHLDAQDGELATIKSEVKALPRALAEIIGK